MDNPRVASGLDADRLDEVFVTRVGDADAPGVVVRVVTTTDTWMASSGTTHRNGGSPISASTLFSAQSISKFYTALTVMAAVTDGLFALDDTVADLRPEFTVHSRLEESPEQKMTVRHLLSHTAGFTHEAPVGNNYEVGEASFDEHVASISDTWLRYPVGQRHSYSNLGFDLVASIIESKSGLSFPAYFGERVAAPLGLSRTTFDLDRVIADADRARGHKRGYDTIPERIPMVAAGGLFTTADDIGRLLTIILRSRRHQGGLVPRAVLDEMIRIPFPFPGQRDGYGLGVTTGLRGGIVLSGHSGGGFGYLSDLYWSDDHSVGAFMLSNSADHAFQGGLVTELIGTVVGGGPPPRGTSDTRPSEGDIGAIGRFAGKYVGRSGAVRFELRDGAFVAVVGAGFLPVTGLSDTEILVPWPSGSLHVRFVADGSGRPSAMVIVDDGSWSDYNARPAPGGAAHLEQTGSFVIRSHGVVVDSLELTHEEHAVLKSAGPAGALYLQPHQPGLWFSSTGEALDLRRDPPTYGNIPLQRVTE